MGRKPLKFVIVIKRHDESILVIKKKTREEAEASAKTWRDLGNEVLVGLNTVYVSFR